ncbi:MAG: segregation/condensation protein A [Desulfobacterales bacterium]|nr:segregation/condensation protein A [Desulfobacterales bacterium]
MKDANTLPDQAYSVKLENIFEGPMDLLVYLIRKNEMDIYDIPIALITDQYIEYIDVLQSLNVDLAGDFILMASTLAHIKSRMLIPAHDNEDEEDPRSEITKPLLEYLRMKSAAELLAHRDHLGEDTFTRKAPEDELKLAREDAVIHVGLFELIDAFKKILENIPAEQKLDFSQDRRTVKERISEIIARLEEKESLTFVELFSEDSGRSDVVLTFLAILEMVKMSLINIFQNVPSGVIRIFYL